MIHKYDVFYDPNSLEETSPELKLYDRLSDPSEYHLALRLYQELVDDNVPAENAITFVVQEFVPLKWSGFSVDLSSEQLSS